jgi:hypothetical protein
MMEESIDDDRLASRVLVLQGIPRDFSDSRKTSLLNEFVDSTTTSFRWIDSSSCLIVFASEAQCSKTLKKNQSSSSLYRLVLISETSLFTSENLQGMFYPSFLILIYGSNVDVVAREMYNNIPAAQRTTTAATRMIGAALGKKIPKSSAVTTQVISKEEPVVDAWDD